MSLYPTTLFHFTKKERLYKILETTFKVSYAREIIIGKDLTKEFAAPMVSFCDLKLSELKTFLHYGSFGIGLTKDWASREGLTPVMYINRHSRLLYDIFNGIEGLDKLMHHIEDQDDVNIEDLINLKNSYNLLMNMYRYIKNYDGELWRHGQLQNDNYRFANEREWRFVPDFAKSNIRAFIPKNEIETDEAKNMFNEQASHIRLPFQPEDIKYLVVEKDEDRLDLIDHLNRVKGSRFDENIIKKLSSRILTAEQIELDM